MRESLEVSSPAFADNGFIPVRYTSQGMNISPPLIFGSIADNAISTAIIMDDPDAPAGVFTHWLIWNIPAAFHMIPEGVPNTATVYQLGNAIQGLNGFGRLGYGGPMPPGGQTHTYRIKVYVLNSFLYIEPGSDKQKLENAINNNAIQYGILYGRYRLI